MLTYLKIFIFVKMFNRSIMIRRSGIWWSARRATPESEKGNYFVWRHVAILINGQVEYRPVTDYCRNIYQICR